MRIFTQKFWSDRLMIIEKKFLPLFKFKSQRLCSHSQLTIPQKDQMRKWACTQESLLFRDTMINDWMLNELHDLAMMEEEQTPNGKSRAERIRGAIARLTQIREFMEKCRKWVPSDKESKEINKK
jgi:hypothetical protein